MRTTGAVLWDLDGTVVDSERQHWLAWRETMAAEGLPLSHEEFAATFGLRNDSILAGWLGDRATPETVARIGDAKEACYRRLVRADGLELLPGAAEWLRRLREAGWLQAIASSAPRANVETVLEALALGAYFDAIVSAEDVRNGKPDPEVFLTAAAKLGARPSQSIVVEDAVAGVEAARRGGMRSIGVSRKGAALHADIVVASLADLPEGAFHALLAMPVDDD
jgi:beta-phosphoglucomutase